MNARPLTAVTTVRLGTEASGLRGQASGGAAGRGGGK